MRADTVEYWTLEASMPASFETPNAPSILAASSDEILNTAPYTGNPNDPNTALWKKYWNDSARAGVDLAGRKGPTQVMSRDQVWEMKAAQRRREAAGRDDDGYYDGGYSDESFQYDTGGPLPDLVRQITWGI